MTATSAAFLKAQKSHAGNLLSYAVALGSGGGLLVIGQAWCVACIVDGAVFKHQSLQDLLPWFAAMLVLILLRVAVTWLSERVAFNASIEIKQQVRDKLVTKLLRLGPVYLEGERSGEIVTLLGDGVEALEDYYAHYLPVMSLAALVPLSILAFVLPFDWKSALVMILTAPLIPFFMVLIGRGAERLNREQWRTLARLGGHFLDTIQGLSTLRLFNASRREARMIERISDDYRVATMKVLRVAFLSSLALEFFATMSIAIVAVLIGFRLLFGEMDFFYGFFILLLAPEFYLPLRSLGVHYHGRMEAIAASERIVEFLDTEVPLRSRRELTPVDQPMSIRFERVGYRYHERPALEEVSFHISPGEHVALVGPSGAGKSTVVKLLLGFIGAQSGRICIDDAELDCIDLDWWRARIAWIPQRPRLFRGSIADNIVLGMESLSNDAVYAALEQACATEFVERLPNGIDTAVGEGGHGLSGGQVQRIALARAFARDARLLILDEPTAHLDHDTERMISTAIAGFAQERSVLSIAHRLSTVRRADRIVVLEHGRVREQGSHDELMSSGGLYRDLVNAAEVGL